MNYFTEFIPNLDCSREIQLTPEMIPSLARAKTSQFLKHSITLSNSIACISCRKKIKKDLVFCPFCGKKNTSTPSWSPISEQLSNKLNALQKSIIFAPSGFKSESFHPYKDIDSLRIRAIITGRVIYQNNQATLKIALCVRMKNEKCYYEMESYDIESLFELLNQACTNSTSFSQSISLGFMKYQNMSEPFVRMSGQEFEMYCIDILRGLGFANVQQTKASGDQGVDIIAEKDSIRYAFQCKYYSHPIGNYAVQEVNAGVQYYNCDVGVVITNSSFTRSAIELAERCNIELWNGEYLKSKINAVFLRDCVENKEQFSLDQTGFVSIDEDLPF